MIRPEIGIFAAINTLQMLKFKFIKEYEVKASPRLLFPYISTASGLEKWFAEKAKFNTDTNSFNLQWDGQNHIAKLVHQKLNKVARFDFDAEDGQKIEDPNFIEFKLEVSDLTQTTYLAITDYSDVEDEQEVEDLWDDLILKLKEVTGA